MKHKWYQHCHLLIIQDESGERLFVIGNHDGKQTLTPAPFLPQPQKFLRIYPEYDLLVSPEAVYQTNGNLVTKGLFEHADFIPFTQTALLATYTDAEHSKLERVILWDCHQVVWEKQVDLMLHTQKHIALYEGGRWLFFDDLGRQINTEYAPITPIKFCGDLVVTDALGHHDVYSLTRKQMIAENRQLVKASTSDEFVISLDLQRTAIIWYRGESFVMSDISFVDIVDGARIFYILHDKEKHYTVYHYEDCLHPFAENIDVVSFDSNNSELLLGNDTALKKYSVCSYFVGGKPCCILQDIA